MLTSLQGWRRTWGNGANVGSPQLIRMPAGTMLANENKAWPVDDYLDPERRDAAAVSLFRQSPEAQLLEILDEVGLERALARYLSVRYTTTRDGHLLRAISGIYASQLSDGEIAAKPFVILSRSQDDTVEGTVH